MTPGTNGKSKVLMGAWQMPIHINPHSILFLQPYTTREVYNFGRILHKFTTCVSSICLDFFVTIKY